MLTVCLVISNCWMKYLLLCLFSFSVRFTNWTIFPNVFPVNFQPNYCLFFKILKINSASSSYFISLDDRKLLWLLQLFCTLCRSIKPFIIFGWYGILPLFYFLLNYLPLLYFENPWLLPISEPKKIICKFSIFFLNRESQRKSYRCEVPAVSMVVVYGVP